MIKFATVRLGKTSVEDIKRINSFPIGIMSSPIVIPVVCTQVPSELEINTIIFLWFGSDNAKGIPTEWKQGFKAVGTVEDIKRGESFNSETTTKIKIEYIFSEAINRLDILRDAASPYFNCANLPIIGIDDHSNQTIRVFDEKQELSDSHAFLYALNKVQSSFKADICQIHPELNSHFNYFDKRLNRRIGEVSHNIYNSSYLPYLAALRTKPFMLLAGISGTGKSRLVKELAFMTCPNKEEFNQDKTTPGNYCLVEVKPNWHDSSELLGYYNALDGKYELTPFIRFAYRALQNDKVPFFVCLDEMNLAPVEQYFAEYLSVLETRTQDATEIISSELIKKEVFNGIDIENKYDEEDKAIATYIKENGLKLPSNLYVIGTVNMDDTTHQFSRKVIDRAFTIEMNGGDLTEMFSAKNTGALKYRDKEMSLDVVKSLFVQANEIFEWSDADGNYPFARYEETIKTDIPAKLQTINEILADTPFQVSYRVQNELILYLAYLIQQANYPDNIEPLINEAVLAILLEKILPRVQGDDKLLGRGNGKDVFTELKEHIERTYVQKEQPQEGEGQVKEVVKGSTLYTQVLNKLEQMHKRLENSYFANFF